MWMRIVSSAFIVMGAFNCLFGGIAVYGLQLGEVTDELATQNFDYMQTVIAAGLLLVAGALLLVAGIFGVRYSHQPELFRQCVVMGVLVLAMRVLLVVQNGIGSGTVLTVLLAVLWIAIEVAYMVLAFLMRNLPEPAPPDGDAE